MAYVIGIALGDGTLSNPNGSAVCLRVTCDTKYPYLIYKIKAAISKALPDNKVSILNRHENYVDIYCYSNKLETLLGWKVGKGSKFIQKARVPNWILQNPKYMIKCLCGLIETDGSIYLDRKYQMVFFTSIISELAQNVYDMISRLGFTPRFYVNYPKANARFKQQVRYNVRLSKNVQEFLDLVKPDKK